MRIVIVGGGPAGLYFAILAKASDPRRTVLVLERNRPDDTFGFGVVLSDATLDHFRLADPESHAAITQALAHWNDIDIHYRGQVVTATGHGFAGLARQRLLDILQARAAALGVVVRFATEVDAAAAWAGADLVVGADGVNSWVRAHHARQFRPEIDWRRNRFVWLGTTFPFRAFTFLFKEDEHGLWRVHAYRYDRGHSTFILECTEDTWRRAGLDEASEDGTVAFAQTLFASELDGHPVLRNRSLWRGFPTVRNGCWHHDDVVLLGDAAHTAHFSIGSGTRLAMEDAIALARTLGEHGAVRPALAAYEAERRPQVEALQRAAQTSLEWFEQAERYHGRMEAAQFAFSLLTRSLRVTHDTLKARDPRLIAAVDRCVAEQASRQSGRPVATAPPPAPMQTPFRLRQMVLPNRIVVALRLLDPVDGGGRDDREREALSRRTVEGAGLTLAGPVHLDGGNRVGRSPAVAGWRRIVDLVHASGGARIGLRLAAGSGCSDPDAAAEAFTRAARLAEAAGFDLLVLHPLGPHIRLEVFDAVRALWPAARPIAVRIPVPGGAEGGLTGAEAVQVARALRVRGCDLVDVSDGDEATAAGRTRETTFSDRLRHETGIPTMTAGAASDGEIDAILAAGRADLCLLGPAHQGGPSTARRTVHAQGAEATVSPTDPGRG